jgi:hypothetical protein
VSLVRSRFWAPFNSKAFPSLMERQTFKDNAK